jgi:hypothetical protein
MEGAWNKNNLGPELHILVVGLQFKKLENIENETFEKGISPLFVASYTVSGDSDILNSRQKQKTFAVVQDKSAKYLQ